MLEIRNLHVRIEDKTILNGLTLTVETIDGRRVGKVLVVRDHDGMEPDESDR